MLGNRERLLAASSPTGPAFEGAQISCGQRAAPGAIERVRIDPETLEPRVKVVGCDAWSDEPGFADARVTGVCGSGIVEVVAELLLAGVLTTDGTIDGSLAAAHRRASSPTGAPSRTSSGRASRSSRSRRTTSGRSSWRRRRSTRGARCLMERYGIDQVDRVRLAGAFGAHIDPVHALVLGLVPDCEPAGSRRRATPPGPGRGSRS